MAYQPIIQPGFNVVKDAGEGHAGLAHVGLLRQPLLHRITVVFADKLFPREGDEVRKGLLQGLDHQLGRGGHLAAVLHPKLVVHQVSML